MPSGKNHDQITWICLPIIILISLLITRKPVIAIIIAMAFVFAGLMFGPDLDIYSIQYQRWKWLRFIWLPYQKNIKHRSIYSHGFLIGTIIRLLYLSLILLFTTIFLIAISQMIFGFQWHWQQALQNFYYLLTNNYSMESIALFIGLELGAMSHYLADTIASRWSISPKVTAKKVKMVSKTNHAKKKSPRHRRKKTTRQTRRQ